MRLFVGVRPSPAVEEVLAALPRPGHPAVRWTSPSQWHVTLRFLGEVADDEVGTVLDAVDAVGRRCAPRSARVGPATRRLGRGVLTVPVLGLDDLAAAVVEATSSCGAAPEARPFLGHLTLARARRRRVVPAGLAGVPVAGEWWVGSVEVVRSHLEHGGARHETVAASPLRGRPPLSVEAPEGR